MTRLTQLECSLSVAAIMVGCGACSSAGLNSFDRTGSKNMNKSGFYQTYTPTGIADRSYYEYYK